VAGPRFGRGLADEDEALTPEELQPRVWADLTRLRDAGVPRPDLLVVTGDLTESGSRREFGSATTFLTGLRVLLGLEPQRLIVVPGPRDVTKAASRAPQRRVFSVEDFTRAQIRSYLVNRYNGDERLADERISLMSGIEDLLGLVRNPRMLSFIADLDGRRLATVAKARHTISAALLYEEILTAWLDFEERRVHDVPGSVTGLVAGELRQAVTALALRLWETGESFLRLPELTEIAETLTHLAEGRLTGQQTAHAMGTGSLIVRTEEGLFGFIHASVMEWLVAGHIAATLHDDPVILSRRPLSQLTVEFLCDLADARTIQDWAARVLADPAAGRPWQPRLTRTLPEHGGRLWTAGYSPDGSMFATAGDDTLVRVWDPRTGGLLHTLAGHGRRIWSLAFGPDSASLASGGDDGVVTVWDLPPGGPPSTRVTLLGLPEGWAAIAPDGRYKVEGEVAGQFWFVVGMCRFEPGELDPYLPWITQLPRETHF
jgi:hypothetical protein